MHVIYLHFTHLQHYHLVAKWVWFRPPNVSIMSHRSKPRGIIEPMTIILNHSISSFTNYIVSVHRFFTALLKIIVPPKITSYGNVFNITGPLWLKSSITGGFFSQRANNMELFLNVKIRWINSRYAHDMKRYNVCVASVQKFLFCVRGIFILVPESKTHGEM